MADSKISALPASTTPLAGTEVLPIVQSSTTKQVSVANLTAGRAISATELTLTTGNLIVASGQGIDFTATAGTGTSELFNDYEEGTWTPEIAGDGTVFVGTTYNSRAGKYIKVGNAVWVSFDVDVNLVGVPLNSASISGIPFAIPNAGNLSNGGGGIGYITGIQQNYVYQSLYPSNNSSYLFIIGRTAASTSTTPPTSANFFANSTRLTGWAWWRTSV